MLIFHSVLRLREFKQFLFRFKCHHFVAVYVAVYSHDGLKKQEGCSPYQYSNHKIPLHFAGTAPRDSQSWERIYKAAVSLSLAAGHVPWHSMTALHPTCHAFPQQL